MCKAASAQMREELLRVSHKKKETVAYLFDSIFFKKLVLLTEIVLEGLYLREPAV